jgi:hypothetical protein
VLASKIEEKVSKNVKNNSYSKNKLKIESLETKALLPFAFIFIVNNK